MKNDQTYKSVIFDLDGTLIDSSPSILECFEGVLKEANLQTRVTLDHSVIGPPLRQTLMNLTGLPAGDSLENLVVSFQTIYDTEGYKATHIYPGVEDMLLKFASMKIPMAIATNKRRNPTVKILEHLGWDHYFWRVGTLDAPSIAHPDKSALIRHMIDERRLTANESIYLGDKWEDGEAAAANDMQFFAANWGYGKWETNAMPTGWRLIPSPAKLTEQLDLLFP